MAVKSPCIDVCAFDGKTGLCVGCLRTREEIRDWKKMTDHRRHQVINDRSRRETRVKRAERPFTRPGPMTVMGRGCVET